MLKKIHPKNIEQKEFRVFNPGDVKQAVEIPVKPKPSLEEIEKIEIIHGKDEKGNAKLALSKKQKKDKKERKPKIKQTKKSGDYILIITEKPQAAGKIAAALSNGNDRRISASPGVYYYELERNGKKIIVACAVGHLFTLSQIKKGSNYPVFDIEWKPNFEVRKTDFTKKYYSVIKKLVGDASDIIIAMDFDVEGEVIGYNIIRFIANKPDAKRMKFSSLTTKELEDSYDNVLQTIEWGQAIAGETRHFLDWLYGINLSRALMHAIRKAGKFKIMSIGRVQGPALHLIVDKEKQILAFKPTPYWQVFLIIDDGKNKLEVKFEKDIVKKDELEKFKNLQGKTGIAETKKSKQIIPPPAPFDLTSLQTEAYKFHGITPSQTLQIAQKLYLDGLISYPRTSSQKIPEGMNPKKILERLKENFSKLIESAVREKPVEGKKSDPAHPAVIPTGNFGRLEGQDEKVYNLIVKRFISCFCEDAELENKRVDFIVDNLKFNARGMEILNEGWMSVYPAKIQEKEIEDMNGEAKVEKVNIEEKETQPPKRYSPASIISELEKRSIGTKSTRSNIIDTLYDRNYIEGKSIKATPLGIKLIDSLEKHSPIIINEKLTRDMEKEMENIRNSKKELDKKQGAVINKAKEALIKISTDFKKQEEIIGKELVEANNSLWEQQKENNKLGIKCPNCNTGELTIKFSPRFKNYFIACTNYPECKQTYSLPSRSLIKKTDKKCEACGWPMLLSIRKAKRPWLFCFNPKCTSRQKKAAEDKEDNSKSEEG